MNSGRTYACPQCRRNRPAISIGEPPTSTNTNNRTLDSRHISASSTNTNSQAFNLGHISSITFGNSFNQPLEGLDFGQVRVLTFG